MDDSLDSAAGSWRSHRIIKHGHIQPALAHRTAELKDDLVMLDLADRDYYYPSSLPGI